MLFYELYKIMMNIVTFVGFSGGDRPNGPPLDLPLRNRQQPVLLHRCPQSETWWLQKLCKVFGGPDAAGGP